jgi:predicted TIM-barrel fold metal-dependent hydrolase
MSIIDIHAHTSNKTLYNLHADKADVETIKHIATINNVSNVVLLATYFPYKKSGVNNTELLKRIDGDDFFIPFGSLDMMHEPERGIDELNDLLSKKLIKGIKLYPGYQTSLH